MTPRPASCCLASRRCSRLRTSIIISSERQRSETMRAFLQRFGEREALLALGCIVSGLVFSILSPYFATPDNLLTVARNSTELLLIGLGMTLLLGIGGIDVSVGSVLGLAAIGIGRLLEAGPPPGLAA